MKLHMKLRWLEVTRLYRNWDDRDKEYVESDYTDAPILQYFDEKTKKWSEIPVVKKKEKHY